MRADIFTPAKRAAIMRAVKARDTAPERIVRAVVCALGYARRYRLHGTHLPGKPDLVFTSLGKAVFVHGCFWHGHSCKRGARQPKDNSAYWRAKIANNRARDRASLKALKARGWSICVVWECECRDRDVLAVRLAMFLDAKAARPFYAAPAPRRRAHRSQT